MDQLQADLTETLYSILLGEADWPVFLRQLVSDRGNGGALFMLQNDQAIGGLGRLELASGVGEKEIADYANYYSQLNPWVPDHILRRANDVIVDHEVISRETLKRTEYYNDYLRPAGYIGSVGVTLSRRGGENLLLTTVFGDEDPAVATAMGRRLEAMKPHLQRLMRYYTRSAGELRMDNVAGQALGVMGAGLCLIDDTLRPVMVTPAAEQAAARANLFTITPTGQIRLGDENGQQALRRLLQRGALTRSEVVWNQDGHRMTLFRAAREPISELLCGPMVGLLIEPGRHSSGSVVDTIAQRFALTGAERRVLSGVSDGLSIRDMAALHGRSAETVRSQVKSLLHKTGCESQLALLQLIRKA
ncbi:helix-turn-helix transcriptional regulator [Xinfangfangia sp. D13-10-4-6]|uniref:helix-turn-helix transcriptional regulator n=1 Tax=Pseudogemmobacter hezensis TaxID=2737662 RepID=UPI001554D13B|nr:helix-turn-helix transcriptional regulator [Pseudogemmobacter hezensis]NPD13978.1 helix-turn-helix transcriptional regulator [Pseudogemmobacter hezensis]